MMREPCAIADEFSAADHRCHAMISFEFLSARLRTCEEVREGPCCVRHELKRLHIADKAPVAEGHAGHAACRGCRRSVLRHVRPAGRLQHEAGLPTSSFGSKSLSGGQMQTTSAAMTCGSGCDRCAEFTPHEASSKWQHQECAGYTCSHARLLEGSTLCMMSSDGSQLHCMAVRPVPISLLPTTKPWLPGPMPELTVWLSYLKRKVSTESQSKKKVSGPTKRWPAGTVMEANVAVALMTLPTPESMR